MVRMKAYCANAHDYRARYYNPTIGRFLSEDPIGLRGGINLYQYAGGSPTNFIDPSGLDKKNPFQCAADNADKVSLAGIAHSLGVPKGGVAGFATDALGGNAFSGLTNLATSFANGSGGGHGLGYNMAQSMMAGPTQRFGPVAQAIIDSQGSNVVMTTLFNGDVVAESSFLT